MTDETPRQLLRRTAARAARLRPGRRADGDGSSADADAEVARLRRRVQKLRERARSAEQETESLRDEVTRTRASLRDPEPDLDLGSEVTQVIEGVRAEHLSYLGAPDLTVLARQVAAADRDGREGLVIEAGTARGGSAIAMAAAKDPARPMKVYDVFGMIPEPTAEDGEDIHRRYDKIRSGAATGPGGEQYYGYRTDLLAEVEESFARHGVAVDSHAVDLVQGLFQDTIDLDEPVAFAHLDGDWYESTMVCLQRIAPLVVPGGRLVLDDYYYWSGCRRAVDEYFADRSDFRLELRARLHAVRL